MSEPEPPKEEEEDDETGAYELSPEPEGERPITMAPLTEIPSLEPLPEDMTTQEAFAPDEVEPGDDDDVVSAPPLPTLHPLDLDGVFLWPIQGGHFLLMSAAFFLIFLGLSAAYGMGTVPLLGFPLKLIFTLLVWMLALPYVHRATLASIAGAHLPPPWPSYAGEEHTYAEGVRMLLVIGIHQAPGFLAFFIVGWVPALVLLLMGWFLYPAALLLFAASGRLAFTHPLESVPIVFAGGLRYFYCLLPGVFALVLRVVLAGTVAESGAGALWFPALVYTGFMVGRLPHECGAISDRLLAISKRMEEEEQAEIDRWKSEVSQRSEEAESKAGADGAPALDEPSED